MLTPHDELLCRQPPTTFDHIFQSDLRWTERIVMYGFDKSGDINVMTGVARYPKPRHGLVEMVFMGAYPRYGYTGW